MNQIDQFYIESLSAAVLSIAPVPKEQMIKAAKIFEFRRLRPGEFLVRQGEPASEFAFIISGVVKEFYTTEKGAAFIKTFCIPGEFTGSYFDLLSKQPSTASIEAVNACELAVAKFVDYFALFDEHPAWERVGRKVAESLFIKKAKREYELLALSPPERYLLFKKNLPQVEKLVPDYMIASYLGITPVALSRIRTRLKGEGKIS
ncbi:Crp/Fnr family transcriptional regulator [Leptospira perolatii]|uniref:Crp/Fnr family transcriptional regulator n=1 Tax=Leptospira perolatii TaxID=2023191 RepID=A0A2M9ZS88_9LEPT|nr:Crp/Fnr family transcriptional regulator [Leptospira perolatii]PJZ71305.1 Crp/Fnr family transcriptional regulator [Leptospira perolatii]PJZ74839.1 Crp/Fnr family transcriptional regulator [Leptospira perolatii]